MSLPKQFVIITVAMPNGGRYVLWTIKISFNEMKLKIPKHSVGKKFCEGHGRFSSFFMSYVWDLMTCMRKLLGFLLVFTFFNC